jgi:hypothetical protein
MTKKKWIIVGVVAVMLTLPIIGWRLYIFSYEDCMFTVEENLCGGSCNFKSVITHNYCG